MHTYITLGRPSYISGLEGRRVSATTALRFDQAAWVGWLGGGGLAFGLADQKEGNSDPLGGLGKVRVACIGRRERRFGTFVFSDGLYLEGSAGDGRTEPRNTFEKEKL